MAKTLTGVVVSDKTDKTIVVSVLTHKNHPIYRKAFTTSKRFMAHDEKNEARHGDTVIISETRPLSARKRHTLDSIVTRAAISQDQTVEAITAEVQAETETSKATKIKKARGEQPDSQASPADGAMRGDNPISLPSDSEVTS